MTSLNSDLPVVAWDLDYTVIYPDPKRPAHLTEAQLQWENGVILNPLLEGMEEEITHVITGRPESVREKTENMLLRFGIEAELYMNPVEKFDQHHIASMKAEHLNEIGAFLYVEDNGAYREVMRQYTSDILYSSVAEVCALYSTKVVLDSGSRRFIDSIAHTWKIDRDQKKNVTDRV
ncbi:hypothetical protein [Bacteroides sp.]|uniref:hypothetical protein n=1 Tax=Bacteroides sp. TaxID=29523 RepID=UPI0026292A9A|nr:hypothetical protein [Bacteroides sp.]MDD3039027.1 hypothetical protein [Bacteroides sp.]